MSEDFANKERIAKLLRFASTKSDGAAQTVSLDDYIGRMTATQESIYYLTADGYAAAKGSPQLEALTAQRHRSAADVRPHRRMDVDVSRPNTPARKCAMSPRAISILKSSASPTPEKARRTMRRRQGVVAKLKEILGDRVRDVRVSSRLKESPVCIVLDEHDMGLAMQRLLKQAGHDVPPTKPTLEINPDAPVDRTTRKRNRQRTRQRNRPACCSIRRNCSKASRSTIRRPTCAASTRCSSTANFRARWPITSASRWSSYNSA